ncbi:MAG: potassium-transporting ATPase subunit F [Ignavibacteria bacterium]|nr:potassium-transporting ATPase subunit F [Ignavibacteria bacterium]
MTLLFIISIAAIVYLVYSLIKAERF